MTRYPHVPWLTNPEALLVLAGLKTAKLPWSGSAGTGPRNLRGRMQALLLTFALANAAGALVAASKSTAGSRTLYAVGLAAPFVLAAVWVWVYRNRRFPPWADVAIVASVCAFAMSVDRRWDSDVAAVITASVFLGAAYGSRARMLIRTAILSAVMLGQTWTGVIAPTTACVFVCGFFLISILLHGLMDAVDRYERTTARERVLASTGLRLLTACDMASIAAATVEGGRALCAGLTGMRVALAVAEGAEAPPRRFRVLGASGSRAREIEGSAYEFGQLAPAGEGWPISVSSGRAAGRRASRRILRPRARPAGSPGPKQENPSPPSPPSRLGPSSSTVTRSSRGSASPA